MSFQITAGNGNPLHKGSRNRGPISFPPLLPPDKTTMPVLFESPPSNDIEIVELVNECSIVKILKFSTIQN